MYVLMFVQAAPRLPAWAPLESDRVRHGHLEIAVHRP